MRSPDPPPSRGPLWRMIALARPRSARFVLGVLWGAAATGSGVALLGVSAWLIAKAAEHPPITALSLAVVATRALGVGRGVARYLERLVTHDAAFRTLADVRVRVYERLARTEPVRRFRSGDLVSRLVSDTDATQDLLVRGLTPPLVALLTGGVTVAVCTALFVPGGLLLAAGLVLAGLAVPLAAAALSRRPGERQAAARGELSTSLVDTLYGAPDLLAYGAMDRAVQRVQQADAELTRVARRDAALLGFGAGATALITGLTVWGTLLLGVAAVAEGDLASITLAVLVLTALAAFEIVAPLPAVAARLGSIRASGERLFGVLDTPPSVDAPVDGPALADGPAALRIRGLKVRYGPDEPWALDGVDLDLAPGRTVAVLGPSGAGKSTLAAVLFRFRDPDSGTVELGGADITAHPVDEVRAAVTGVPQDPHIFASTLRENLRLARPLPDGRDGPSPADAPAGPPDGTAAPAEPPEAPAEPPEAPGADPAGPDPREDADAELWAALRRARLADEVAAMPDGLDTEVGSHGTRLSGGMRRRLALARALLAAPRVLLLDEPTAHLDPDTRDEVVADLLAAAEGYSALLITHDLAGLDRVDDIYVIADGRVLQHGTHEELLSRDGWYRDAVTLTGAR